MLTFMHMDNSAGNPNPVSPQPPQETFTPLPPTEPQPIDTPLTEVTATTQPQNIQPPAAVPPQPQPPTQQPVMPEPPVPPPPPTINTTEFPNPSKKWILLAVGIIGGILIVGAFAYFATKLFPNKKSTSSSGNSVSVLSKYSKDTDGDGIPDVVETEIGLDPNVSEIERCKPASCETSDKTSAENTKGNILFIIDSSGSMGLKIGSTTKMDLAKQAIRNFLNNTKDDVNVGIMVYGNKGSNSEADKAISCSSADTIASIGSVTASSADSYLSQIQPVGWTPIGLAIKNGINAFSGKEGQKNQIIVVTDGAETCNTNPAGAASEAKVSAYQIQVNVIGFAVSSSEQSSLQAISTNGGGIFSVANNADDIYNQMQANLKNFQNFQKDAACINDAYTKSTTCLSAVSQQLNTYFSGKTANLHGSEWSELTTIQTNVSSTLSKQIFAWQDEQSSLIKNSQKIVQ